MLRQSHNPRAEADTASQSAEQGLSDPVSAVRPFCRLRKCQGCPDRGHRIWRLRALGASPHVADVGYLKAGCGHDCLHCRRVGVCPAGAGLRAGHLPLAAEGPCHVAVADRSRQGHLVLGGTQRRAGQVRLRGQRQTLCRASGVLGTARRHRRADLSGARREIPARTRGHATPSFLRPRCSSRATCATLRHPQSSPWCSEPSAWCFSPLRWRTAAKANPQNL
jgi:hypothetical protein